LKSKEHYTSIRDLFRKNLEYAEVVPSPDLKATLMHKVARKEFLNFNAGRFNIFYLGSIVGAIFVASSLIFAGNKKNDRGKTPDAAFVIARADIVKIAEIPAEHSVKHTLANNQNKTSENSSSLKPVVTAKETALVNPSVKGVKVPENINVSYSRNDIFRNQNTEGKILMKRSSSVENVIFPVAFSGCAPLRVQFRNTAGSYDSCRWTFGDGGFSDKKEPEWIYDVEGEYKVGLEIFSGGKSITSSSTVNVYPRPKAHFEFFPEKAIIPNDNIRFMNYSVNAERFDWDFGDGSGSELFEPDHTYRKPGSYDVQLVVFSAQGCSDTLKISNAFSASEYFIDFPNAFIPNEQGPSGGYFSSKTDEAAQVFHPSSSGVSDYQLKIFSKLGILIFESNDINSGWDGYNKGQLCDPGVYIWKVRGKFRNGEPFIRMGDVTLLKI
jgi:PKD repeat protein